MSDLLETLITPRLVGCSLCEAHFAEINRLHTNLEVMRTLSADGKPLAEERTREHLRQAAELWARHGFGFWLFRHTTTGEFAGRGGLKIYPMDGKDVIGLAYAVMPEFWNQGYATEMARASLQAGFAQLGFAEIDSWTLPINGASQRVMEKLGFRYQRDFEFAGLPHRYYRLTADEWKETIVGVPKA